MYSNELYHHGVRGQRWGVRRSEAQLGNSTSHMSDEELRSAVSRMQLERQYKDLSRYLNPEKKSAAKKFVDAIIIPSAVASGKGVTTQLMNYAYKSAINGMTKKSIIK